MKFFTMALLVAAVQLVPVALPACDCGCTCEPLFRFKDGIAPNGPSNTEAIYADPAHYGHGCGCDVFGYRDYGPARVIVPPPVDTKEMKHPSS